MKKLAIIGPTASGKSDLALRLAKKHDAYILSIDSLAIYKEFDIVSAKPSPKELQEVRHFGVDEIEPTATFNVEKFLQLYQKAKKLAEYDQKNLIIVGGTGFYLKMLIDGISKLPLISKSVQNQIKKELRDLGNAYERLLAIDPTFARKIAKNDRYRIEKGLGIYYATSLPPSRYFEQNPPIRIDTLPIYEIAIDRETLRSRIAQRTRKMIKKGLIDEIAILEKKYGRAIQPMKAIGVVETLKFLDGTIKSSDELAQKISTHTAQLAKRQQTFNKTQFQSRYSMPIEELEKKLDEELAD